MRAAWREQKEPTFKFEYKLASDPFPSIINCSISHGFFQEARDRLSRRADDAAEAYINRRRSVNSGGSVIAIFTDESPTTPFRWGATPLTGSISRSGGIHASVGRFRPMSPLTPVRQRNESQPSTSRGQRGSTLPDWYPRSPLGDVTATVRALERRRSRLGEDKGPESPTVLHPTVKAQPEYDASMFTPYPKIRMRPHLASVGKLSKVLFDITKQESGESSAATPQKKLLNSIDVVDKVLTEELQRLRRTPMAKKSERERKVRTLMSMR